MSNFNYKDIEGWENQSDEITDLTEKLNHLIENCTGNMSVDDLEQIQAHMKLLIVQGQFWLNEDNPQRFVYDLKSFAMWLCDHIGECERSFWGEDEE